MFTLFGQQQPQPSQKQHTLLRASLAEGRKGANDPPKAGQKKIKTKSKARLIKSHVSSPLARLAALSGSKVIRHGGVIPRHGVIPIGHRDEGHRLQRFTFTRAPHAKCLHYVLTHTGCPHRPCITVSGLRGVTNVLSSIKEAPTKQIWGSRIMGSCMRLGFSDEQIITHMQTSTRTLCCLDVFI